jgi:hypothetical protein
MSYTFAAPSGPLEDICCDIDADIDFEHGEPVITVTAVLYEGMSLLTHDDALYVAIGKRIAELAEANEAFAEEVMESQGVYYSGAPNDPAGKWRAA